jgi:hypothetical protein
MSADHPDLGGDAQFFVKSITSGSITTDLVMLGAVAAGPFIYLFDL